MTARSQLVEYVTLAIIDQPNPPSWNEAQAMADRVVTMLFPTPPPASAAPRAGTAAAEARAREAIHPAPSQQRQGRRSG